MPQSVATAQLPVALLGGRLAVSTAALADIVPTTTWVGSPWDGVAAKKLTLRTGAGPIKILQVHLTGGGGGGGVAERTIYIGATGFTPDTDELIGEGPYAIADPVILSPIVPIVIRCDASGQCDFYVVPNAGTTEETITVETETC